MIRLVWFTMAPLRRFGVLGPHKVGGLFFLGVNMLRFLSTVFLRIGVSLGGERQS
jgi:hypothetical protein